MTIEAPAGPQPDAPGGTIDPTCATRRRAAMWLTALSAILLLIGGALLAAALEPMALARLLSIEPTRSPPEDASVLPLVFIGFFLLMGAVGVALGVRFRITGRMDRLLLRILIALFAIFLVVGILAGGLFGHHINRAGR